MQNEIAKITL